MAVHGALIYALVGRSGDAERWATAAERTTATGTLADGNTMEGSLAYLRALLCRRGLDEMRRDARVALDGLSPTSPYRPAMLHAEAAADLLQGNVDQADASFALAVEEAASTGLTPFVALLLAERGIIAIERGSWLEADAFASRALSLVGDGRFDDYWTSALVFAWGARVAFHRGDVAQARDLVQRAARLRPLLTHALPIVSAQALLELLARVCRARRLWWRACRSDPDRRCSSITARISACCRLRLEEVRARLEVIRGEVLGLSSLTTAELRLLPTVALASVAG